MADLSSPALNVGQASAGGRLPLWETLGCAQCGNTTFLALITLKGKPASGTTSTHAGWQCSECRTVANVSAMQSALLRAQRKQELEALLAEDAASPLPSSRTSA